MKTEHEGMCPKCKSPAILILTGNRQGRQCENCNAGWYLFDTNYYNYTVNTNQEQAQDQTGNQSEGSKQ